MGNLIDWGIFVSYVAVVFGVVFITLGQRRILVQRLVGGDSRIVRLQVERTSLGVEQVPAAGIPHFGHAVSRVAIQWAHPDRPRRQARATGENHAIGRRE